MFGHALGANLYFESIVEDVGVDWPQLARTLKIDEQQIRTIRKNIQNDINEQCREMLNSYYRDSGKSFPKWKLVEALYLSKMRSVAEKIQHLNLAESANIDNTSRGEFWF